MIDKSIPVIPETILPDGHRGTLTFTTDVRELWTDILDELCDDEFITRIHHNVGTYDKGCRGPLCRKALREHPKRRTPTGFSGLTPREERLYDPVIEYFHTVAKFRIKTHQHKLYRELTS